MDKREFMIRAHQMTKETLLLTPWVEYRTQLSICMTILHAEYKAVKMAKAEAAAAKAAEIATYESIINNEELKKIVLDAKLEKWVLRAYHYANLNIGENDDAINDGIDKYKALRNLSDDAREYLYMVLADRLGVGNYFN